MANPGVKNMNVESKVEGNTQSRRNPRFVIIGAGMAGVLAVIRLREAGYDNLAIYEKADRIGGTWRENTYPGLTCDVPAHVYTYAFAPKPDWTKVFAPGPEIFKYFQEVSDRYGVTEIVKFNEEVNSCIYQNGQWHLSTKSGLTDVADYVIAATGVLHHPFYPNIAGLEDFKGAMFHSSRWDHSVQLDGAKVGIIGTGSTGVQIVSALSGRAKPLIQFMRTPQWIKPVPNVPFTEDQIAAFKQDEALLKATQLSEEYMHGVREWSKATVDADSAQIKALEDLVLHNLEEHVKDPVLREKLRPNYRAGCKRIVLSPDYYEKVQHPDVRVVTDKITRVEAGGVRTADGTLHELDVLVLATGFKADAFLRPMNVVGNRGVRLNDVWAKGPSAYLAMSIPDFPNLFMLNGPTGPVGNFSLIDIADRQLHYILKLVEHVNAGNCRGINVTHEAMEEYETGRLTQARKTIFATGCHSWYLDDDGIPNIWPWTYDYFQEETAAPKLEKFELVA
jgi:cation diffusion facilitator CzcD-associated flavoprotein CzcO